jgi:hypothetical protein
MGQPEQNDLDRTNRQDIQNRTASRALLGQDIQSRTARTRQLGEDSQKRRT